MRTIRLSEKTGKDGSLSLSIPLGHPDREYEVVIHVVPKSVHSTPAGSDWPPGYFDRTYGSIEDETFERPLQDQP